MKNLKIIFTILLLISVAVKGYSQNKTVKGEVTGTVLDKNTGSPLETATIQIFKSEETAVFNGGASDKEGKFLINEIPEGKYTVKVSYIGYGTAVAKNVQINKENQTVSLGTIKLEPNTEMTQEIEVIGEAPIMTYEQGKKVYDVKKDLTAQTGTVLDMLKNIPSVDVDNDGNVSLRGSGNVKILIDGKPSALLSQGTQVLQNLPASVIEKVEIINNPGAKYEAEGVSGIINLVMKVDQKAEGYGWNLRANSGTQDKYNMSGGAMWKKDKLTLNGNYSFWRYLMPGITDLYRNNFSNPSFSQINQKFDWKYKGMSHFGSFGLDYEINKLNTLSFVSNGFYYDRNLTNRNKINFYDLNNSLVSEQTYFIDDSEDGYNLEGTLTYTKRFEEKGRDFTTFLNFSRRFEDSYDNYKTYNYNNFLNETQNDYDYTFNFLNFQADYVHPFSETNKLETGLKSNYRNIFGDYKFRELVNGNWQPIPGKLDNDADYKDLISAAYLTYSGSYKDFSYQTGLRSEHTYLDFSIMQGTEKYNRDYIDFFPSASLSQKIGNENSIQATYSRRINRPNLNLLNPFVEQFDEYTKRSGNPYLNPEYIHSFELGYTRYLPVGAVTLTGYFRNTNNTIQYLSFVDSIGVNLSKPDNLGKSNTYGLEFIMQGGLAKWWTFYVSASYFNTNIFDNATYDKNFNAWRTRFNTNAAIPGLFDVQLSYFYSGKQYNSQGAIDPFQMLNLAVQKSFFEKKLTIGIRIQDLLNQLRFQRVVSEPDFSQTIFQKTSTRTAFLFISLNFGEQNGSKSKRTAEQKQRETEGQIQQTGN
ncbi:MAG: TonB-dependent receptor [Ignavibacteria bacterium]|nr:TonB-dependent receptor [Ignavibacteria bacterium]